MNNIKAGIIGNVCLKPYKDYRFLTCFELHFYINDKILSVPERFETDLASIPRIFWSIVAPYNAKLIAPAIVHDWLYTQNQEISRKEADIVFYLLLKKNGMSKFFAKIMYYSVRVFGKSHFKSKNLDLEYSKTYGKDHTYN